MEEVPKQKEISQEDESCENNFQDNIKQKKKMAIWIYSENAIQKRVRNTRKKQQAAARFIQLERKFQQKPELKQEYTKFIQ